MNLISEIHGKSSERTVSNAVAGYVVPITALGLSSLFDTMKKKKAKKNEPIVDLEGEIWEPVVGYEGLYEVSNKGRVKSLRYGGRDRVSIMKVNFSYNYPTIMLCKNAVRKVFLVHRLEYEAFNGKLPEFKFMGKGNGDKMFVINHLDENKHNNCLENLELTNQKENNNYGTRVQRMADSQRNRHGSKKVYQFTFDGKLVKIWPSTAECGRNGYNEGHVAACCRGVKVGTYRNVYKGFIWSYTNEFKIIM